MELDRGLLEDQVFRYGGFHVGEWEDQMEFVTLQANMEADDRRVLEDYFSFGESSRPFAVGRRLPRTNMEAPSTIQEDISLSSTL